eukprot:Selendium_serpulae@DN9378_c0_g1_i1.p1
MWPYLFVGAGFGGLAARSAYQSFLRSSAGAAFAQKASRISWQQIVQSSRNLQGFESPMSHSEACKILGVSFSASKESVKDAHRMLMRRNHPDQGGSNFIASKVNEAKDIILGKR